MSAADKRHGFSISVKMIFTTAALIVILFNRLADGLADPDRLPGRCLGDDHQTDVGGLVAATAAVGDGNLIASRAEPWSGRRGAPDGARWRRPADAARG